MRAMFPPKFGGITVEVHRGVRDRFGDVTRTKVGEIRGCVVAPRYSYEVNTDRTTTIVGFSIFGPPGADIKADDQIKTPDGNFYNVVGEAAVWGPHPFTGWVAGFEAGLERVK